MKLSEVVRHVIELGNKVYDYYTEELPKWHPNYPLIGPDDKDPPPPPEEKELRDFLVSLPEETIYQLLLVMFVGRGDDGTDNVAEFFEELNGTFGNAEQATEELMNKASLAHHLEDGLEELRKRNINVDRLPLKKIKARTQ